IFLERKRIAKDFLIDNNMMAFATDINIKFMKYIFDVLRLSKFAQVGALPSYNGSDLYAIKVLLPVSQKEQEKIAGFLGMVDDKISVLQKKKELLKKYKKGVMQAIFSQKIRFKDGDGKNYPDWEEKLGNDVFRSVTDRNNGHPLPILAITQDTGAVPRDQINYDISVTDASVENYKVVRKGDFIISLRSFQGGIEYSNYNGLCSPAYIILRASIKIDERFYKYFLKTKNYIQRLTKKLEGIRDGKMISFKYFSEVPLPYPMIEEQRKIAKFLTSLDDRIKLDESRLEQAKQFKKALLQQMFV
ncbi:MAG: restriction endonuclease subunit S, partial [bacterium]|nr:restriction endonuclease subunit S [bacterium]